MADEASASRSGAKDYRWQDQAAGTGQPAGKNAKRRRWLTVLAGLFLALAALVAVWLLLVKPPPPMPFFLAINLSEHDNRQYPTIPFAARDFERLARHFPKKKLAETKTKELLLKELAGLADNPGPVIVQIRALALAREGKVFLIPGDADPGDEATWVDARAVLDAVQACPAKHKLLVLDINHPWADPRLGVLSDRVPETLEAVVSAAKPAFHVLSPCSPGQSSLTSEVLQGSVLACYLDQGLQGAADVKKEMRISVKELFAFADARVDRWAQQNRALRQKPRLLGDGVDFVVATLNRSTPGEEQRAEPAPYPERLEKGWKGRDQWWNEEAFRRAPRLLRKLEANLLRQEKLLRGGAAQKKELETLDEELDRLNAQLKDATPHRFVPPRSLALAVSQSGVKDSPEFIDGVLDVLGRAKDAAAKKDVNAKVEEELAKKLQEPKGIEFPHQASAVVEALNRMPALKPDHLRVGVDVLEKIKPKLPYVEIVQLQRLIAFADRKDAESWHSEKMTALLQTTRAREKLIALLDREPGLLPWISADIEAADKLRQAGEDKLLWKGKSTWDDGFAKVESAKAKYEETQRAFDIVYRCRWQLDRALAELPAYLNLICNGHDFDAQAEKTWTKAAQEADRVQTLLLAPPPSGLSPEKDAPAALKVDTAGRELERHLQGLAKMLAGRVNVAKKEEKAETADQLVRLLDSALLSATTRVALAARQRELALKLHEATETQDRDDNQAGRISATPAAPRSDRDNVGLSRARMSLALLVLGKFDFKGKPLIVPAADSDLTQHEWAELETRLQRAWSNDLPKQWRGAAPGPVVDVLNRMVSPWEMERRPGTQEKDASRALQESQRGEFVQWLRRRYEAELKSVADHADDRRAGVFYTEAVRELGLRGTEPE
jgi:hypothetical protein